MAIDDKGGTTALNRPPMGRAPVEAVEIYKPTLDHYFLKMVVYGNPGVGKTTLCASAQACPDMYPALFVNVEGGQLALTDARVYGAKEVVDVIDIKNSDYGALPAIRRYLIGNNKYKTIVIDSLSELAMVSLDTIVDAKKGQKGQTLDTPYLEDYGTLTKVMRRTVREFRDLPMHVLYTAHDAPESQEPNAKIGPNLTPKLLRSVMGYVDVVGYMYTAERKGEETKTGEKIVDRKIIFSPVGRFMAKDRSPGQKLGASMTNPTMTMIMNKIKGTP
jgi:phage nucleotide-binding protein